MPETMIAADDLRRLAAALFRAAGVGELDASLVAESLVASNLRGHDSHGVIRVREYVAALGRGELVAGAEFRVVSETAAVLVADAGRGFGQVQMLRLLDRLRPKALGLGIATGALHNCGHVGRLGEWVERAADGGLASLLTVNDNGVLKCVAPPGCVEPRISTNPLAIGVPTGDGPLVLDMSTSVVANGKLQLARSAGRPCPPGWLLDADGNPTTDPNTRFADPPGSILPLGGVEHGYKGFGLGLLLDILVGGLSGGYCPPAPAGAPALNNVLLAMWDPERLSGRKHLVRQADKLIAYVRSTRRRPGVAAIQLPGDHSREEERQRTRDGIPLDAGTWQMLLRLAERLDVSVSDAERLNDLR